MDAKTIASLDALRRKIHLGYSACLVYACKRGWTGTALRYIRKGANLKFKDDKGRTALDIIEEKIMHELEFKFYAKSLEKVFNGKDIEKEEGEKDEEAQKRRYEFYQSFIHITELYEVYLELNELKTIKIK